MDSEQLRSVMRKVPAPVAVVTASECHQMRGLTIGSLVSVSMSPALISFNVGCQSRMHEVVTTAAHFAVHLLSSEQSWLAEHFAVRGYTAAEQFGTVPYHVDNSGTPILDGVLAVLRCRPYSVVQAGDHSILVGEVVSVEGQTEGMSLLYCNRTYLEFPAPAFFPPPPDCLLPS